MNQYHEVLGLDPDGQYTPEDYKKAYRKQAMQHHPDKGGDEEKFKKLTEAYEILIGKRQEPNRTPPQSNPFNVEDLFRQHFTQHAPRRGPPEKDEEVFFQLEVSVADIKKGRTIIAEYNKSEPCQTCAGKGGDEKNVCQGCQGTMFKRTVHRSEHSYYEKAQPCDECQGRGIKIVNPCKDCHGNGFKVKTEMLQFQIKQV